jgi:hypothetical protein
MVLAAGGFVFAFGVAVVTYRALAPLVAKRPPDTSKA